LLEGKTEWKKVYPIIGSFNTLSPNSFIEEKPYSLAWHYRNVEPQRRKANSRELIRVLNRFTLGYDLKILDGNKVIEIISKNINKGAATRYLLNKKSYDFILSIGDDITDEDMFGVLLDNNKAYTVKIGRVILVQVYLANIQQVIKLLEQLLSQTK
jgi:trehalose 6-phosphate synthase/phosphatase